MTKPFCLAPWVHTQIEPNGVRKLCCIARDPQADTTMVPFDQFWNGDYMRGVRRMMLDGKAPEECVVCTSNVMRQVEPYLAYWDKYGDTSEIIASTADDGSTTMEPVAYDYRFSNQCTLKCRICYEGYSSSIEAEMRAMNQLRPGHYLDDRDWRRRHKDHRVHQGRELMAAAETGRIREIYWAGGEPLLWKEHWDVAQRLIDLGHAPNVHMRYNSNLSRITYGDRHWPDVLERFGAASVFASMDGTGKVGEWLRDGTVWETWQSHFDALNALARRTSHRVQVHMDVTVSYVTLIDFANIAKFAKERDVLVLCKTVFPDPSAILSPCALPTDLRNALIDRQKERVAAAWDGHERRRFMLDYLDTLRESQSLAEMFGSAWEPRRHKDRLLMIAERRGDGSNGRLTIEDVLAPDPDVLAWWRSL